MDKNQLVRLEVGQWLEVSYLVSVRPNRAEWWSALIYRWIAQPGGNSKAQLLG